MQQSRNNGSEKKLQIGYGTIYDSGVPFSAVSTNIYVDCLAPDVTEDILCQHFGRFGPIASVKIMWPRKSGSGTVARTRMSGFVSFMDRQSAQRAMHAMDGTSLHGLKMNLDWSKPVSLPSRPLYVAPEWRKMGEKDTNGPKSNRGCINNNTISAKGINSTADGNCGNSKISSNNGNNKSNSNSCSNATKVFSQNSNGSSETTYLGKADSVSPNSQSENQASMWWRVDTHYVNGRSNKDHEAQYICVEIPDNDAVLRLIHKSVAAVLEHGSELEKQLIKGSEKNPSLVFLSDPNHPYHHYYRWRLQSLRNGDSYSRWSQDPIPAPHRSDIVYIPPEYPVEDCVVEEKVTSSSDSSSQERSEVTNDNPKEESATEVASSVPDSDHDLQKEHFSQRASPAVIRRLRALCLSGKHSRTLVARTMALCIDASEAALDISAELARLVCKVRDTSLAHEKQVHLLHVISDVAFNSTAEVANAWRYPDCIRAHLGAIMNEFAHTYSQLRKRESRWIAERFRARIMAVLGSWRQSMLYPRDFIASLEHQLREHHHQSANLASFQHFGHHQHEQQTEQPQNVMEKSVSVFPQMQEQVTTTAVSKVALKRVVPMAPVIQTTASSASNGSHNYVNNNTNNTENNNNNGQALNNPQPICFADQNRLAFTSTRMHENPEQNAQQEINGGVGRNGGNGSAAVQFSQQKNDSDSNDSGDMFGT